MAITMKARVRSMLAAMRDMMKDKTLPKSTRDAMEALDTDLKKAWGQLADEGAETPPVDNQSKQADEAGRITPPGVALLETGSIGAYLESQIHSQFTLMADDLYQDGAITRDERKALSGALGDGLDAFITSLQKSAPALYVRQPGDEPDGDDDEGMDEAGKPKTTHLVDETDNDPNVGGGVDRDKLPAEDFAGKDRSFPIVKPGDVSDAAASIGRAGADNYSSDQLKANIIRIAKRKGAAFVAQLPKAWTQEADDKGKAKDDETSDDNESARSTEGGDPISESLELAGDFFPLEEAAVRGDGTIPIKIIQPGWGSSGYYPPDVLKRDGPQVFKKGTKMYWNHPTPTEEAERPERDLRDLAAELTTDARWLPDHPKGAGLYANAQVFKPYQEAVDELAPHIGVSIRALGKAEHGTADGKAGPIIKEISAAKSVDFVTSPGAGGQILQLFEAHRTTGPAGAAATIPVEGEIDMGEKELQEAVAQLQADNRRLVEALLLREASETAATHLLRSSLPDATRERLMTQLTKNPPIKDGALDREAFVNSINEAIKTETQYLSRIMGSGRVVGMGFAPAEPTGEDYAKQIEESFRDLGLDEKTAKLAAKGR